LCMLVMRTGASVFAADAYGRRQDDDRRKLQGIRLTTYDSRRARAPPGPTATQPHNSTSSISRRFIMPAVFSRVARTSLIIRTHVTARLHRESDRFVQFSPVAVITPCEFDTDALRNIGLFRRYGSTYCHAKAWCHIVFDYFCTLNRFYPHSGNIFVPSVL